MQKSLSFPVPSDPLSHRTGHTDSSLAARGLFQIYSTMGTQSYEVQPLAARGQITPTGMT